MQLFSGSSRPSWCLLVDTAFDPDSLLNAPLAMALRTILIAAGLQSAPFRECPRQPGLVPFCADLSLDIITLYARHMNGPGSCHFSSCASVACYLLGETGCFTKL